VYSRLKGYLRFRIARIVAAETREIVRDLEALKATVQVPELNLPAEASKEDILKKAQPEIGRLETQLHGHEYLSTLSHHEDRGDSNALCLRLHHVGGRDGARRFPVLSAFEPDFINVLYEADEDCVDDIGARISTLSSRQVVVNRCIGEAEATEKFFKLWNASASSILPISSAFIKNYRNMTEDTLECDPLTWEPIETRDVRSTTLDHVVGSAGVPPPDFLSLNTQGSELAILRGAQNTLQSNTLAVQTEISVATIYEGQARFDDITDFLSRFGFQLFTIMPHALRGHGFPLGAGTTRTPIGLRGGGAFVQMDALYFKAPSCVLENHADPTGDLAKALFLGFAYKYFDYSYACAEALSLAPDRDVVLAQSSNFKYLEFVVSYLASAQAYRPIYPVKWTDVFQAGTRDLFSADRIRQKYFQTVSKQEFKQTLPFLLTPEFIGLEKAAIAYGLTEQAELLKYARLSTIWGTLRYLGLCTDDSKGNPQFNIDDVYRL